MSYDALRRGRYSLPQQIYCITTVTRDRCPLFTDMTTARVLIRELRRLHDDGDVHSLAWVVRPDHLHWMIQLNEYQYSGNGRITIARSERMRILARSHAILSLIHCERIWFGISAVIPIGTASG